MNVTKSCFSKALKQLSEDVSKAEFVALDFEFTGELANAKLFFG